MLVGKATPGTAVATLASQPTMSRLDNGFCLRWGPHWPDAVTEPHGARADQTSEDRLRYFRAKKNSMLSTRASQLASMIFVLTPTVPHSRLPSLLTTRTRVLAAVPVPESMMRTL